MFHLTVIITWAHGAFTSVSSTTIMVLSSIGFLEVELFIGLIRLDNTFSINHFGFASQCLIDENVTFSLELFMMAVLDVGVSNWLPDLNLLVHVLSVWGWSWHGGERFTVLLVSNLILIKEFMFELKMS